MIILILIISIFNSLLLNNINISIISFTIFSILLSIFIIYPYLKNNKLIIYSIVCGLLVDILFNHFYINFILFPLCALLIITLFKKIKFNFSNIAVVCMFILFLYLNIMYTILKISNVNVIPYQFFLSKLIFIYIFNIIYIFVFIFILELFNIKKYRHIK